MWDPRTYTDTDFGLDDDEPFEPAEDAAVTVDPAREPHIMTVLGPIAPDELGVCQPFEHLLVDPPATLPRDADLLLNDIARGIEELTHFATAGGRALVDATTKREGRDMLGLRQIAQRVPVHIIASTGAVSLGNADAAALAEEFLCEVIDGVGPRGVRPGSITATVTAGSLTPADCALLTGAAKASRDSGVPVTLRFSTAPAALHGLDVAISGGIAPARLTIGATEGTFSHNETLHLLESGAYALFTRIGLGKRERDAELAASMRDLAARGFADRILVSQGIERRSQMLSWNGSPGLVYLLERFALSLMEAGAGADLVRSILIDNPARALTIHPSGAID